MYVVVKKVKGHSYRYLQKSWREGRRVRTKSICLGPIDRCRPVTSVDTRKSGFAAFLGVQRLSPEDRAMAHAERRAAEVDKYQRERFGETAAERVEREHVEHLAQLYSAYGLTVSDPKIAEAVAAAAAEQSPPAAEANESPSGEEGQGSGENASDGTQNN